MNDIPELQFTDVKETSYGIRELQDFNNLFGYRIKLPSETIGNLRKLTKEQIAEIYPLAYDYIRGVKSLTNHLKSFGSGKDVNSFKYRTNHIEAMKEFLCVAARLQFIRVLNEQINVYKEDNVGWGIFDIKTRYEAGEYVGASVFIGDQDVTDKLPLRIQAINWYGKMIDGIQLVDLEAGKTTKRLARDCDGAVILDENKKAVYEQVPSPANIVIQITDDSLSNQIYADMLEARNGAINKTSIKDTLLFSPLQFMVMRVEKEDDFENDIFPTGYDTPIFKELDYSHEIPFLDHVRVLEKYHQLKDKDLFFNSREFATLNLLRWGIVDKATWDRGVKIFDTVIEAKALWGVDTIIDGKVVKWATAIIDEIQNRPENKDRDLRDDIVVSGSAISKIASVQSQSYFRTRALVVDSIDEENKDINFRDTYVTFRFQREITNMFQSMPRLNTHVYKIIECDKDGNMIKILNPVDVFAIANHDITAVVVRLDASYSAAGEGGVVTPSKEHTDYYNQIVSFKDPE